MTIAPADQVGLATSCPGCGLKHDGNDTPGRRSWPYNEATRARLEMHDALPPEAVGVLPSSIEWSFYKRKEASTCTRFKGEWDELVDFLEELGRQILPGGDKREAPFVSQPAYGNGRSLDENCESITVAWFDSDGAGEWDKLKAALSRSGVAAVFVESTSRKPGHWHVGIPLTKPKVFIQDESTRRKTYKQEYHHLAAVFSALAGFAGVGGHCGLDLCTDRLVQPMFPAMRRTESETPARFEVLSGGAIDWPAVIRSTGFDLDTAVKSEGRRRRAGGRSRAANARGRFTGKLGPIGLALQASGMLGTVKDSQGLHAACPFFNEHSGGGEWGSAIYFPSSDVWWCPRNSCGRNKPADVLLAALPPAGRAAYDAELEKGTTFSSVEVDAEEIGEVAQWAERQIDSGVVARGALLKALIGVLVRYGFGNNYTERVAAAVHPNPKTGRDLVRRTVLRFRAKKAVRGAGWLRRTLGPSAVLELVRAVHLDTGNKTIDIARRFLGLPLVRGDDATYLREIHDGLGMGSKIQSLVRRPAECLNWKDGVYGDGDLKGYRHLVCEDSGCPRCWMLRTMNEIELIETGWRFDGLVVEGWVGQGPFTIHRLENIPDYDALEVVLKHMKRHLRFPRVRLHTIVGGKPALLVVTNHHSAACDVASLFEVLADRSDMVYTETDTADVQELIAEVTFARLAINVHQGELIRGRRTDELLTFLRWRRGKHLVSRSKAALPWPPREVVRKHGRKDEEEMFDRDEVLTVEHRLTDVETGVVVHRQEYPHTCYDGARYGDRSTLLIMTRKAINVPLDDEAEAWLEQQLRAEVRQEQESDPLPF